MAESSCVVELFAAYRERAQRLRVKAYTSDMAQYQALSRLADEYEQRAERLEKRQRALRPAADPGC